MINATEARVKSLKIREELKKQEKQTVEDAILKSTEKGGLSCSINSKISADLVTELKIKGYNVEVFETPYYGADQVVIKW